MLRRTDDEQVLEVWTENGRQLQRRILLDAKLHGKVIDNAGGFGRPRWNPQESAIVFAAERKPPSTASFFEASKSSNDDDKNKKIVGGQFTLGLGKTESWGEQYSKQSALLDLFIVSIETGKVVKVENVPGSPSESGLDGFSLGDAVWTPDGQSIVYVGWDAGGGGSMPRRLGLVFCQQRPSKIYCSPVSRLMQRLGDEENQDDDAKDAGYAELTQSLRVARSPRFSPSSEGKSLLVYLAATNSFDTHNGCFGLHSMEWTDGQFNSDRVIVDQVADPVDRLAPCEDEVAGLPFPGLFTQSAGRFLSAEYLLTNTQWGSCQKVVLIRLSDGKISLVKVHTEISSDTLLCLSPAGAAIIGTQLPNKPLSLVSMPSTDLLLGSSNRGDVIASFHPLSSTRFSAVSKAPLFDFSVSVAPLANTPEVDGVASTLVVQNVIMIPDKERFPNPPLIVTPHGGPHSASSTIFFHSLAYLCGYGGYAILMVNYRGSTGFGQASIEALPTRIGDMDVKDVVAATEAIRKSGLVDPNRVGICGGSHGGFLTAHCTSRYPSLFKAAATRNPVVNIASMVTATDIPDWCYVEALGEYDWTQYRPPTANELETMWKCSPVRHVSQVKSPTLLALGLSDLRVPPSQGLEWYHSLRSMGVPVKLLTYPDDDHAIAGVVTEADHWVNVKRWFDEHL